MLALDNSILLRGVQVLLGNTVTVSSVVECFYLSLIPLSLHNCELSQEALLIRSILYHCLLGTTPRSVELVVGLLLGSVTVGCLDH